MKTNVCTPQQQEDVSNFLLCFDYKHGANSSAFNGCATENGFSAIADDVLTCAGSAEGKTLRAYNLDQDKPDKFGGCKEKGHMQCPPWFPYVLVDGVEVTSERPDDIDHFGSTWQKYICTAYKGTSVPAACKKWQQG